MLPVTHVNWLKNETCSADVLSTSTEILVKSVRFSRCIKTPDREKRNLVFPIRIRVKKIWWTHLDYYKESMSHIRIIVCFYDTAAHRLSPSSVMKGKTITCSGVSLNPK